MFNKVSTFRVFPPARPALGVTAAANDNRRNMAVAGSDRTRIARPVCRWSLSPDTGRLVCHWELDSADDPRPSSRRTVQPQAASQNRLATFLSKEGDGVALPTTSHIPASNVPLRDARGRPGRSRVLHVRH